MILGACNVEVILLTPLRSKNAILFLVLIHMLAVLVIFLTLVVMLARKELRVTQYMHTMPFHVGCMFATTMFSALCCIARTKLPDVKLL